MKKIKAVIFDWAGTTVDFGCMAPVQAFVEVFKQYGIEPTMEEVRKPMGMLKIDHIRTMLKSTLSDLRGEAPRNPAGLLRSEAGRGGGSEPPQEKRIPDRFHHRIQ